MAHKKVKSKTPKHRTPKHRTKISQKVIQKVIVKIGEERKAKKARRRHRRTNKAMEQEFMQQQAIQEKVAPIVVYQTAAPFQAPKPSPSIIETVMEVKPKPSYVISEPDVEPLFKPKEELLIDFINPVDPPKASDPITSEIYTKQVFPEKKVVGNYAFGKPDVYSELSPSSLYDNELGINKPQQRIKGIGEFINMDYEMRKKLMEPIQIKEQPQVPEEEQMVGYESGHETSAKPKRSYRSRQEIQHEREKKLQLLLELGGFAPEKAFRVVKDLAPNQLEDEIRRQKLSLRAKKIKIPKK